MSENVSPIEDRSITDEGIQFSEVLQAQNLESNPNHHENKNFGKWKDSLEVILNTEHMPNTGRVSLDFTPTESDAKPIEFKD